MTVTIHKLGVGAISPWYGSNRTGAEEIGRALAGCGWVGIPFAGGMCELPFIKARTIQVNDRHRHIINLARVIKEEKFIPILRSLLDAKLFHPDELSAAQRHCRDIEDHYDGVSTLYPADAFARFKDGVNLIYWAAAYAVCCWMSRHETMGTANEFDASMSLRWDAGGGGSGKHYRSFVDSILAWSEVLKVCDFTTLDCFEFLAKCRDLPDVGIYCDPPWPDAGDKYKHHFTEQQQRQLAAKLAEFKFARVVIRIGDHPLVREIYPESLWEIRRGIGRTQRNKDSNELLIVNRRAA